MNLSLISRKIFTVLLVPLLFLIISIFTLKDYGINWDTPKHLIRGQSYLHFIFTGKHNFLDTPPYPEMKGGPDYIDNNVTPPVRALPAKENSVEAGIRRSYFQSDLYTFDYFMTKHEHTHPEVNDLLLALTNHLFYQKLGIIGDIEAHHLFIILITFALTVGIALWTRKHFGVLAAMVATSSLVLYPQVFAESHFNVKDPVLMSFFGLAILTFHVGFTGKKYRHILLSAVLAGFALGTKFNALFLPLILGPWTFFYLLNNKYSSKKKQTFLDFIGGARVLISIFCYPFIMLAVLYALSPYLWPDPIGHFVQTIYYYHEIGTGTPEELSKYVILGWNTYPLVWIWYATPLPILGLSLVGLCYSTYLLFRKGNDMALLVLLWLFVPIVRVVWPGTNVYGGVRQIMEFVPAFSVLAGTGAYFIVKSMHRVKVPATVCVAASLLFVGYELAQIHPNQNVYFNQLAGGLSGAVDKKIPSAGNEYGNTYLQGINWLNKNAEKNAKLALPINYISSIPRLKLRPDIGLDNAYFSGLERSGEYAMEIDWGLLKGNYKYAYYETFLSPVYEVKVDEVSLLKIWKNDLEHTKPGYEKEVEVKPISAFEENGDLRINFSREALLTRLSINHSTDNCNTQTDAGYMSTSTDGEKWAREPGLLTDPESPYQYPEMDEDTFVFMFPARSAKGILLRTENSNSCILKNYKISVWEISK